MWTVLCEASDDTQAVRSRVGVLLGLEEFGHPHLRVSAASIGAEPDGEGWSEGSEGVG